MLCSKMQNLVNKYKTISLGYRGKPRNSPKTFCPYWSYLKTCFGVSEKSQLIVITGFPKFLNVECSTVKYSTGDNETKIGTGESEQNRTEIVEGRSLVNLVMFMKLVIRLSNVVSIGTLSPLIVKINSLRIF